MKRISLRAGGFTTRITSNTTARPQKDPIYPDRYRPSGIGDNTNKKRKAVTIQPPRNHSVELKFHPIRPLMRKRPAEGAKQDNPIDLTADSDVDLIELNSPPPSISKRQKFNANVTAPKSANAGIGRTLGLKSEDTPTNTSLAQPRRKGKRGRGRWSATPATNILRKPLTGVSAAPFVSRKPLTVEEEITKQLMLVKTKLEQARKDMNTCQATMKSLFDTHYAHFDNDEMMLALQKLSSHMNKVYDSGKDGVGEVDRAVALLHTKEEIL